MTTLYRITDNQLMYGQTIQNVVHFRHASSDPATMDTLLAEFRDSWVQRVRSQQSGDLVHTVLTCRMLESQFAPRSLTINLAGSNSTSGEFKLFQAHILRLRSATIGKHGRGRVYIGGMAFNLTTNGVLKSTMVTAWNTQIALIMGVFGPGGTSNFDLVVLPRDNPQAFQDIVSMSVAPTEGCQRRRNVGVGI